MIVLGGLALYGSGLFVIFTPLPFFYFWQKKDLSYNRGWVLASFLISGLLLFFFYHTLLPVAYYSLFFLIGILLAEVLFKNLEIGKGFLLVLGAVFLWSLLLLAVFWYWSGNPIPEFRASLLSLVEQVLSLNQKKSSLSGEELLFMTQYKEVFVDRLIRTTPSLFLVSLATVIWVNLVMARRFFRLSGHDLTSWKVNDKAVWGLIFIGILYFANAYSIRIGWLTDGVINGLVLYGMLYFMQGMAVVASFLGRRPSSLFRMAVYLVIFLFVQTVGFMVIGLGLFDIWFDFRKVRKG